MKNETKWSIDQSHTESAFRVRHLMIAHIRGSFKKFDASIYTVDSDFSTAEVDVWIDPSSIATGDEARDEHLKGEEFFDVHEHKQIIFTSSTIGKPDAAGNCELWGELTIKGNTRNIKLNVTFGGIEKDPWGKEKAGFTVTGSINRSEWGLNWNTKLDSGGIMVSDEVQIMCEVELINAGRKAQNMVLESEASQDGVMHPTK